MKPSTDSDLERLYGLLQQLRDAGQSRLLGQCAGRDGWPPRGVYFFTEPGEYRRSGESVPRIVRVGTHAVSAGAKSTLWGRLRSHRGGRDGGGNHRGSIFRLHVGAALLARDGGHLPTWGVKSSAPLDVRRLEAEHERRVSEYLGTLTVTWVAVPDEPGVDSLRAFIERNCIALLSRQLNPADPPSEGWLGRHSPRREIRQSGLWNLNYVEDQPDASVIDTIERLLVANT